MSHHTLDARRLLCPMPVIKTQDAIADLKPGDTLEIIATDPGALNDIPAWCRVHGHQVLESHAGEEEVRITVQVGDS